MKKLVQIIIFIAIVFHIAISCDGDENPKNEPTENKTNNGHLPFTIEFDNPTPPYIFWKKYQEDSLHLKVVDCAYLLDKEDKKIKITAVPPNFLISNINTVRKINGSKKIKRISFIYNTDSPTSSTDSLFITLTDMSYSSYKVLTAKVDKVERKFIIENKEDLAKIRELHIFNHASRTLSISSIKFE